VIAEGVKSARLSGFRILADAQTPLSAGIVLRDSEVEIDDVEVKGAGSGSRFAERRARCCGATRFAIVWRKAC